MHKHILITLWAIILLFTACQQNTGSDRAKSHKLKIAISKASGSRGSLQYAIWLKSIDTNIITYDLYPLGIDSAMKIVSNCDALLISGGADVHPNNYGEDFDSGRCEETDRYRDSLELNVIDYAIQHKMPVLGICRGEQILNVYFGGSLFQDIPTDRPENVGHRRKPIDSNFHQVNLTGKNLLYRICDTTSAMVNSAHHQAVKHIGTNIQILAYTQDSIPEAISWADSSGRGFMLGVQWHPEWLSADNLFSQPIGARFITEARKFQQTKKN